MLVRNAVILLSAFALPGCVAKTAWDVATAPVRVAAKAVDLATTSQSEADEKRGRELRKREARLGALERRYARDLKECSGGSEKACERARSIYAEMQELYPTIPVPPPSS